MPFAFAGVPKPRNYNVMVMKRMVYSVVVEITSIFPLDKVLSLTKSHRLHEATHLDKPDFLPHDAGSAVKLYSQDSFV